jgi:hypothetical protein
VISIRSKIRPTANGVEVVTKGPGLYELKVKPGIEYVIVYKAD